MPRGIKAKTKAERVERLLRRRWGKQRIAEFCKCSLPYVYTISKQIRQGDIVAKLMRAK